MAAVGYGVVNAGTYTTDKFVGGSDQATDGIVINTNKFTVAADSGNTLIAGTLAVTGATTLTGALVANGGITCDTDAFTVADTSGNTVVKGTFTATGAQTHTGALTQTGAATFNGGIVLGNQKDITANKLTTNANHFIGGLDIAGASAFTTSGLTKEITFGKAFATTLTPVVVVTPITDTVALSVAIIGEAGAWTGFTVTRASGGTSGAAFGYIVIGSGA